MTGWQGDEVTALGRWWHWRHQRHWQHYGMVALWCGCVAVLRCGRVTALRCSGVMAWQCYGVAVLLCCGITVWQCYGMMALHSKIVTLLRRHKAWGNCCQNWQQFPYASWQYRPQMGLIFPTAVPVSINAPPSISAKAPPKHYTKYLLNIKQKQ